MISNPFLFIVSGIYCTNFTTASSLESSRCIKTTRSDPFPAIASRAGLHCRAAATKPSIPLTLFGTRSPFVIHIGTATDGLFL
ncbi:hypothetical protein BDQ94DRAFT_49924 [Aspergillus welwitschiae]|uniref:Uncharacterized protein n=1 Tax=Aspergillus welwitschiae TaxID=1341132 RepID=A0A3F3PYY3_9EURO|nr:hypothetical protein BDQ94DRAFT_49924 [Aspergillus welwitschiae]RDH32078.1 hypothetical protein BDQ94DRAFT_49924 [Aspergillus welwitschiae]